MRSMGLDVGDKRIGVAISDPMGVLASPNTIIERKNEAEDAAAIAKIAAHYEVKQIIIGEPISLDGRICSQAEKVHTFAVHLVSHIDIPIDFRDERMTTVSAQRLMREGRNNKGRNPKADDAAAAAVLLQSYLDEKAGDIPNPNF